MSNRLSYLLTVLILLMALILRMINFASLPAGFTTQEFDHIRVIETVRSGTVETFYTLRGQGQESLYHIMAAALSTFVGTGLIGYRLLALCAGMLTLAFVYVLGKRLFGPRAGLVSMSMLAVGLLPIMLSRTVLPETLLPLLTAATLLALAQSLSVQQFPADRQPNTIAFAALGLLLGFGFYLSPLHFPLVLAAMAFITFVVLTRQTARRGEISYTSFGILILMIVAMPYLITSLRQPELAGAARLFEGSGPSLINTLINGLVGIFFRGDAQPALNLPGRPLVDLITGFIIVIGLMAALSQWRQPRYALIWIPFFIMLPVVVIAPDSPDFSRFAVILPVLALLFGAGVEALRAGLSRRASQVFAFSLAALLVFNTQWLWRDLFTLWPTLPAVQSTYHARLGQIARHLDRTALYLPTVICTPELYPPDEAPELIDAQMLALMMHVQTAPLRYTDCGSGLVLARGGDLQQVVFLKPDSFSEMTPYVRDWVQNGVPLSAPDLADDAVIMLNVSELLAERIGLFTTLAPASYPPEAGAGDQIAEIPVRLGGNIAFLGYDRVETPAFRAGDVVPIYTYWRVDGPVPRDLRLFTHLLSDPTVIAAQADILSTRADLLQPRDIIVQATFLQLPFTFPAGRYIISTGAYEASLGTRLGVFDGDQLRGNRLFIGTLDIAP